MMLICGLVQASTLEDRLDELIPIAEQALKLEGSNDDQHVKLQAMHLFRRLSSKSAHLPFLLASLSSNDTVLKLEALHALTEIAGQGGNAQIVCK